VTLTGIILGSIAGLTGAVRMALAAGADPKMENQRSESEKGSSNKQT
jgi:hypothetical protein